MNSGWYCPFCNAHHAPHVDTCPRQNARGVRYMRLKGDGKGAVIPVVSAQEIEDASRRKGCDITFQKPAEKAKA